MTADDDATILGVLEAVPNLTVYDGHVEDSDDSEKTISAPLPYLVFDSSTDRPRGDSLAGDAGARLVSFRLRGVGETRDQAKLVLERGRSVLDRKRVPFPSGTRLVRRDDAGLPVGRDDIWTRPDGGPLFYGVDRFDVLI